MKVVYHEDYNEVYTSDPAASPGRIRAVESVLKGKVTEWRYTSNMDWDTVLF